jgi:hypothetical protein
VLRVVVFHLAEKTRTKVKFDLLCGDGPPPRAKCPANQPLADAVAGIGE